MSKIIRNRFVNTKWIIFLARKNKCLITKIAGAGFCGLPHIYVSIKVWLKFNDNSVNEASWEELLKESIGGRSNTSAYSLVYIDTSKPEILLQTTEDTTGNCFGNTW